MISTCVRRLKKGAIKVGNTDAARVREIIVLVSALPISIDYTSETVEKNLMLSLQFGLTSYDAAYLGLAMRLGMPIATKDGALRSAAGRVGVGGKSKFTQHITAIGPCSARQAIGWFLRAMLSGKR